LENGTFINTLIFQLLENGTFRTTLIFQLLENQHL
jgi:hypothetical protein